MMCSSTINFADPSLPSNAKQIFPSQDLKVSQSTVVRRTYIHDSPSIVIHRSDLRRASALDWLSDLGDLLTSTHNTVAILVLDVLSILCGVVIALPDLNLHATTDDTYSHGGE